MAIGKQSTSLEDALLRAQQTAALQKISKLTQQLQANPLEKAIAAVQNPMQFATQFPRLDRSRLEDEVRELQRQRANLVPDPEEPIPDDTGGGRYRAMRSGGKDAATFMGLLNPNLATFAKMVRHVAAK